MAMPHPEPAAMHAMDAATILENGMTRVLIEYVAAAARRNVPLLHAVDYGIMAPTPVLPLAQRSVGAGDGGMKFERVWVGHSGHG